MTATIVQSNSRVAQAALDYASRGWPVVLVHGLRPDGKTCACPKGAKCTTPGKHPVLVDWPNQASCDEDAVATLYDRNQRANVGVKLGQQSGIIDIECDDEEAEEHVLDLFDNNVPICPTFQSSKGKHRIFKWSSNLPGLAVFRVGKIEIRTGNGGKGAQSVFPPSKHAVSGPREWLPGLSPDDVDPPELPASVVAKLWNLAGEDAAPGGTGNGKPPAKRQRLYTEDQIAEGDRDNVLLSEANGLWRERYKLDGHACFDSVKANNEVLRRLRDANLARLQPPMDDAVVVQKCDNARAFIQRQTAAESAEVPATKDGRQAALDDISKKIGVPLVNVVQYGREDASYQLDFDVDGKRESITIDSTAALLSLAQVRQRLLEKLHHYIREVTNKDWPDWATRIAQLAHVVPGVDEVEHMQELVLDYMADCRMRETIEPRDAICGGGHRVAKSFLGTDGIVYIKLVDFQSWLGKKFVQPKQSTLKRGMRRLGFDDRRVQFRDEHQQVKGGRYWTIDQQVIGMPAATAGDIHEV